MNLLNYLQQAKRSRLIPGALTWIIILAGLTTILRVPGMQEMATWQRWMALAIEIDPVYAFHADPNAYPPGAISILYLAGIALPGVEPALTIKILLLFFSALTSITAGLWLRSWPVAWATLALTGFAGAGLGLLDILYLLPLTLAMWSLANNQLALFSFFFSTAAMIKWQPIILGPVIAIYILKMWLKHPSGSERVRMAIAVFVPAIFVIGVTIAVFGWSYVLSSFMGATQQDMLSGNALNFNWLLSAVAIGPTEGWGVVHYIYVTEVPAWMPTVSKILFAIFYVGLLWICLRHLRSFNQLMVATLAAVLLYGMLAVGAHENHLFLVLPAALAVAVRVSALSYEAVLAISLPIVNVIWFSGLVGYRVETIFIGSADPSILAALIYLMAGSFIVIRSALFLVKKSDM